MRFDWKWTVGLALLAAFVFFLVLPVPTAGRQAEPPDELGMPLPALPGMPTQPPILAAVQPAPAAEPEQTPAQRLAAVDAAMKAERYDEAGKALAPLAADPEADRAVLELALEVAQRQKNSAAVTNILGRLKQGVKSEESVRGEQAELKESPPKLTEVVPEPTPSLEIATQGDTPPPATALDTDEESARDHAVRVEEELVRLVDVGRYRDAAVLFEKMNASDPTFSSRLTPDGVAALGMAYGGIREDARSYAYFREALRADSGCRRGAVGLARILYRDGSPDEAVTVLRRYLSRHCNDVQVARELADVRRLAAGEACVIF